MLTLELLFQKRDPPVLVVAGSAGAGLECGSGVLEEFLLPTVEHRGVDPVLVTQVRNGGVFEKMEPKNGDLLLSCEAIPDFLGHGKTSTRNCSLFEQTVCHISTEAKQIKVRAYRRVIHRRRYQRTCNCNGTLTLTAPPTPKLIPKGRYGISVWVEVILDKYFSFRPTERLLASWRLLGLDLAPGTVTDGLQRLEVLLRPIYEALQERNRQGDLHQADETRWPVFIIVEGKEGYGWWLWVYLSEDTVVFLLNPSRGHTVPENHFRAESRGVLVVDRFSAYKAMSWVKDGVLVLAFCWAHVRRDFVRVGKGWPELETWALEWLRRIRTLYRLNRRRLAAKRDSAEFKEADGCLRQAVAQMKKQMETELARTDLATPCRKVLESLQEHWVGLTLFVDDPRIPMDNNASERRGRGPALARKNFYGSGSDWSGELAATAFSIFATLSMEKLNPRNWLRWYFKQCAAAGGQVPADIQRFLPWNLTEETKKELSDHQLPEEDDTS